MLALQESILVPVSPEDPCGPNLEYDPAFVALERAFEGKAEQQIGSTVVPAEPPNWRDVQVQARDLLGRSKDLRAACRLAVALLQTRGFEGFGEGLTALSLLVERHWEDVHPRLDPDDDRDPTMRVNILLGLADPAVIAAVRTAPLVASKALGRFCLKDVEIATGDLPVPDGATATPIGTIEAAMMDSDLSVLEAAAAGARASSEAIKGLEAFVTEQVGAASAPSLGKVQATVRRAADFLTAGLARRQPVASSDGAELTVSTMNGTHNGLGAGRGLTGEITTREDVVRALDKICAYYARYEPSSPLPMFMERCKKLVSKSFIDIVRDLVPDAVSQVEVFKGRDE